MNTKHRLLILAVLLPLWVIAAAMSFMAIESYVHQGDAMEMTIGPEVEHGQRM